MKEKNPIENKKKFDFKRHFEKYLLVYVFVVPAVIHFFIFFIIPVIFSFVITFLKWPIIGEPSFVGLRNWKRFLGDTVAHKSIINTFKFSLYYIIPTMALGLLFATLIHSVKREGVATFFKGIFFLPVVTSFVVISGIWEWMFKGDGVGLINQFLALLGKEQQLFLSSSKQALKVLAGLSIYKVVGNTMIYYYAGLQGIPDDVYEAAEIDGAGKLRQFFSITMPLLLPIHFYVAITTTIGSFQIFDSAHLLTSGGPNYATSTIVYHLYQQGFVANNFGYASVLAYILFFFILVITLIQRKYLGGEVNYV